MRACIKNIITILFIITHNYKSQYTRVRKLSTEYSIPQLYNHNKGRPEFFLHGFHHSEVFLTVLC